MMDTLPYEETASRGESEPAGLDVVDGYAFLSLRVMYRAVKDGNLSRAEAATVRKNILHRREVGKAKLDLVSRCADVWKRAEAAGQAYQRNKTHETAEAFYKAVYNLK